MKVKEESEKVGLKFNIQKTKIMASGPVTSWEINGETVETVSDFYFGALKSLQMVTAAMKLKDAYSLEGTSVVSNSLQPYGPQPVRLLCPWDSPGKNTGVVLNLHLNCAYCSSVQICILSSPDNTVLVYC